MSVSNTMQKTVRQQGGTVTVNLTDSDQAGFFQTTTIKDGTMNFANTNASLTGTFSLVGNNSKLGFANGATLLGSQIGAGYGTVDATGQTIDFGSGALVSMSYDGLANKKGSLKGNLKLHDSSAKIQLYGYASEKSDTIQVTSGTIDTGTNSLADVVDVNVGWLNPVTNLYVSGTGVMADFAFTSLTNTSLGDLPASVLQGVDTMILAMDSTNYYTLNTKGPSTIRYAVSQLPDVADTSFNAAQQMTDQIANRGTEMRSMNNLASNKPKLNSTPTGVAGPDSEEKTMQGWIRGYGAMGNKEQTGTFDPYDSTSWGTIIGIDKSFGNVLVGLAGGYASTEIDAGNAYQASVKTYHGSIYSTIGGESIFVDLVGTYGRSDTTEYNWLTTASSFNSDLYSGYAGIGKCFKLKKKYSVVPEASLLASFYEQGEFSRGNPNLMIDDYHTWSAISSLGASFATQYEVNWYNHGIAFIPEFRAFWLHEFNADPDGFSYTGSGSQQVFAVRPRDEDSAQIGVGLDMWSWRFQDAKLELDYDGLFAPDYTEHIFSGKLTWKF